MRSVSLATSSWHFRDATEKTAWRPAIIPGCVHRDLRRHKLIPDPFWGNNEAGLQWIEQRDWEYRTEFSAGTALLAEEVVELVADGLDTLATVTLNGREVAHTENMFIGYRWDVKRWLRPGKNSLLIRFHNTPKYLRTQRPEHRPREINDPVGRSVVIRKQQCQFGWDWGPRFVTAGIWRDLRLEAWSGNRLADVLVTQHHHRNGEVTLEIMPELVGRDARVQLRGTLSLDGKVVARIGNRKSRIANPELWWPNGQGAQPLYQLEVEAVGADGASLGRWSRRIGLRTITLDRHEDQWGESFQFVVNGRPIFAKGANWIPAHSFVAGLKREDYSRDLRSAAEAHMNMIRVWGGGIYESEDFYDLCDELGLLVWQDFMFACTLYPADRKFLESSRAEAQFQARRLRHRASLALWCGNNEVFACNHHELVADKKKTAEYDRLFHRVLPAALGTVDAVTPYWPGSPWRGDTEADHAAGEARGDTHFWDVWHSRQPVKDYEKYLFRFTAEFGMQSYSSPETNTTFCPPHANNVFGHEMENHQKNRFGNQIILDYISRLYRFPKNQQALIYLSQLNQAYCMQVGVEHYRRNMPRCMGALYGQLNDCWPVASWSSIEFTGKWRALHHVARRFFAPAIVSAHVPGEEGTIISNYRKTTVRHVHLYTVSDLPETKRAVLRWDLFHVDGRKLLQGRKAVALRYGQSVRQKTLDLGKLMERHGRDNLHLRIALRIGRKVVSEETVLLTPPRFLNLRRGKTKAVIRQKSPTQAEVTFSSSVFQHRFAFDLPGVVHSSSDNYFELHPDQPKVVTLELAQPQTLQKLRQTLTHQSLVETY